VLVAAVATVLRRPLGPYSFDAESAAGKFQGMEEPSAGLTYFRQQRSTAITETEAVVAAFPSNDSSRLQPVDREQLPEWCKAALRPWTSGDRPWPPADSGDWHVTVEAGWPMRAFVFQFGPLRSFPRSAWNSSPIEVHNGVALSRTGPDIVALPYGPSWIGMLVDTAVFSASWCALFASLQTLRRFVRHRRGMCALCGYNRSGLGRHDARCPECGAGPS